MFALRLPIRAAARMPLSTRVAPVASILVPSRSFATPGRPKKSETSSTKTKKPASKKPAKKAPHVKLTEEQKAQNAEERREKAAKKKLKQDKDDLKALKQLALTPPSRRPISIWAIFVKEQAKDQKITDLGTKAKEMSEQYRNLSSREKEHYNHLATENNVKSQREFDEWLNNYTPVQIREANLARKRLRAKVANKAKYNPIKDPRAVKAPMSVWMNYYVDRLASGDFRGVAAMQSAKDVGAEFKSLTASERKKYEDMAVKDIERYRREHLEIYGVEAPSVIKPVTASPAAAA